LIVPAISVFEVFKRPSAARRVLGTQATALMQQGRTVALDPALAMAAAKLSFELKLPMAESIILAVDTARQFNAVLWTQDADFEKLPGVRYVAAARA
jgi:toxin FitB